MKYRDPNDPLNGEKYHTGEPCIEPGCSDPAGTAWSPLWCQKHNAERIDRISGSFERIANTLGKGE